MTSVSAINQELAPAEIDEARQHLEEACERVFVSTEGLSEAAWNYGPASGGWSVAGIVEHMVVIQDLILGPIGEGLAKAPESHSSESHIIDSVVKVTVPDRSRKFLAPESVHPRGRWRPTESLNRLRANTQRLIDRLESTPGLRQHRVFSPPLNAITNGEYTLMDGYQWILAAAGHTERHRRQLLEVKAEPGFPTG
ncbi:MAG: DinB family protein [Acidobacteriaceae bacterium]|nr:DinB family protein [Acidobacteriaceae bacterium]